MDSYIVLHYVKKRPYTVTV